MQPIEITSFPWAEELEKTVVNSLTTSFGLDFLLFKDKIGGDVDTVHNVRQGVWATEEEKQQYNNREVYNTDRYHDKNIKKEDSIYKTTGANDKLAQQEGRLHDSYRNTTMRHNEARDLDHVISAKEVHNDPGRILAELDGATLANQNSNLQSTHRSINRSMRESSIDEYLIKLPDLLEGHEKKLVSQQKRLADMPRDTPEQRHNARVLEDEIRDNQEKIKQLKAIDPDEMRKRDREARIPYNQQINFSYYTSSKFLKQTANTSGIAGLKMGSRQMLGLIMAEVWFELREKLPKIFENIKNSFNFEQFIHDVKQALQGIWQRIQKRFKDFLTEFKDGFFAGVVGSVTTTLFNIFATTQKMAIKIIRELWGQLVKAIKLIVFNPDQLSFIDLCKTVVSVLSAGAATVLGTITYTQLLPLCNFPFGGELAAFASAFVTGIITLGLNYVLLYSDMAKKVWEFIASSMPHAATLKKFLTINAELDRYLLELGRLEFNLDTDELEELTQQLTACSNEIERSILLQVEVAKRGIELPYEMGNAASTRKWLSELVK